jgi:hypothetical protein
MRRNTALSVSFRFPREKLSGPLVNGLGETLFCCQPIGFLSSFRATVILPKGISEFGNLLIQLSGRVDWEYGRRPFLCLLRRGSGYRFLLHGEILSNLWEKAIPLNRGKLRGPDPRRSGNYSLTGLLGECNQEYTDQQEAQ